MVLVPHSPIRQVAQTYLTRVESNLPLATSGLGEAKARLYVRIGAVFILASGVAAYLVWDFWAAAITVPLVAMLWFWYIRRWFMRRYVPSPGELPTVELEASNE